MSIIFYDISTRDGKTTTCLQPSDSDILPQPRRVGECAFYKVRFQYKLLSAATIKIQASQKYVIYFLMCVYCI